MRFSTHGFILFASKAQNYTVGAVSPLDSGCGCGSSAGVSTGASGCCVGSGTGVSVG